LGLSVLIGQFSLFFLPFFLFGFGFGQFSQYQIVYIAEHTPRESMFIETHVVHVDPASISIKKGRRFRFIF